MTEISLDTAVTSGSIELGRGNIISSKDVTNKPGDYPIYSSSAQGKGEFGRYADFMFDEELITWSVDGGGRFFFRPKHKFSVTNVSGYMRIKDEAWNRKYVYYSLDFQHASQAFDYQTKAHPSVIRHIYKLKKFSPTEQAKIAEVLATVDQAIEQTEALIAKQERIKIGLMQDLLTRGIDEHGQLRTEQTQAFKDSPLGRIPVDWNVQTLESLSEFVTSGSRGWAQYYATEGVLFLRIGNLTRQHINMRFDDVIRVTPPESAEGERTSVKEGDLLISITADLGIVAVIPAGFETAYVNQHIALTRLDQSQVNARFIGWFLNSQAGQAQIDKLNESGAKAGLNLPAIKNLYVPVPTLVEQKSIAAVIDAATEKSEEFHRNLDKLKLLKRALMQDLLSGRKRVTDLLEPLAA